MMTTFAEPCDAGLHTHREEIRSPALPVGPERPGLSMNVHCAPSPEAIGGCIQATARRPISIPASSMCRYLSSETIIVAGMLGHESSNISGAAPEIE
ncbi:hypothetical protein [Bradyrhizobium sp. CCBAU 51765]|uniref:hypothetical protein n=1 Tax=Bradyrhizobium sp. CCBAU 51765 TaxID=1325102 RepID=UPI00188862A1|nr:hypothetical protein [Bradyrhizobium sp. CCBAU 51765]